VQSRLLVLLGFDNKVKGMPEDVARGSTDRLHDNAAAF